MQSITSRRFNTDTMPDVSERNNRQMGYTGLYQSILSGAKRNENMFCRNKQINN